MTRSCAGYFAGVVLGAICLIAGCGQTTSREGTTSEPTSAAPAASPGYELGDLRFAKATVGTPPAQTTPAPSTPAQATVVDPLRKIIYTATVTLAVEDFTGLPDRVRELVAQCEAYVAGSSLSGSTGNSRHGHWTIRVPVARFDEFVAAAKELGELITASTSSNDVSEEYYDVEARIRNKTKEEERLLKLLEERPGKLEDVIAIERELSRVREELERMQGRMRVLQDLTSLTTVELSIKEIRDYEPPQAPTLATRIRRTFAESVSSLRATGEYLLLAAVGAAPWVPLAVVACAPLLVFVRRRRATVAENQSGNDSQ